MNTIIEKKVTDRVTMLFKAIKDWETNGDHTQYGLCWYFFKVFEVNHDEFEYVFPEIYTKRTKGGKYPWTEHYWFNDREERISVLKETLTELLNSNN